MNSEIRTFAVVIIIVSILPAGITSWIIFRHMFGESQASLNMLFKRIDEMEIKITGFETKIDSMFKEQEKLGQSLHKFQETLYQFKGPLQIESGSVSFAEEAGYKTEHWLDITGARCTVIRIRFAIHFSEIPRIVLSPSAIIQTTEHEKFGFDVRAIDVTKAGFAIIWRELEGQRLQGSHVDWIAYARVSAE